MALKILFGLQSGVLAFAVGSHALAADQGNSNILTDHNYVQCVDDAVRAHYPAAKRTFYRAEEREKGYEKFGDLLVFRQRGLSEINTVSLSYNWHRKDGVNIFDYETVGFGVTTRKGEPFLWPQTYLRKISSDETYHALIGHERRYSYSPDYHGTSAWLAAEQDSVEHKAIAQTHQALADKITACHP